MKHYENDSMVLRPTNGELEILQVLWQYGPSTVRFINDKLNEAKRVVYTSTLKLMQLMVEKGMLEKDESGMKHIYTACLDETATKSYLLNCFVNTTFNGSAGKLILQLLADKNTAKEELEMVKDMLGKLDGFK
jgi:predicted transcriptional regulator